MELPNITYDSNNIFAKIIKGEIPSYKIFETDTCLAVLDAFPTVPGHALLISKLPKATLLDMSAEEAAELMKELPRLCRAVQQGMECDGVNVLQNNGSAAGQVVFHVHFHVIPRFAGDGVFSQFKNSKTMVEKEEAAKVVSKIQAHL